MTYDKHDHNEIQYHRLDSQTLDVCIDYNTQELALIEAWKQEVLRHAQDQLEKHGIKPENLDGDWRGKLKEILDDVAYPAEKPIKNRIEACGGVA